MSIITERQYNLAVDKYKLLSSTSGVGAVIASKTGNYVLISSIDKWPFIQRAFNIIQDERQRNMATLKERSIERIENELGLNHIDDARFVDFLKSSENLSELLMLLPVPEINLNDTFNTPEWQQHPIKNKIDNAVAGDYMVQATHFPKWFVGNKGKLQALDAWRQDWQNLVNENDNVNTNHFAPPRNPEMVKTRGVRRKTDADGNYETMDIYNELTQTNLALICDHGHLMDIPWSKYININAIGNDPVNLDEIDNCCGNPSLKWTENSNKSEGFENVFVECRNCGRKKNLGGINSFKCLCKGHKPWEMGINGGFTELRNPPTEICSFNNNRGTMEISLVTANRMYYATGKNSLYIPMQLKPAGFENQDFARAVRFCEAKYERRINQNQEKEAWFDKKVDEDFLIGDVGIPEEIVTDEFINQLRNFFTHAEEDNVQAAEEYDEENYRLFEYKCFTENENANESGFRFNNVKLSENLSEYFDSIKQVSELKLTQVQLSFNRNKPRVAYKDQDGMVTYSSDAQRIFAGDDNVQYLLPAVQNYGEGIFFQFNMNSLDGFVVDERVHNILNKNFNRQDQGYGTWETLNRCGQKYFIVHSFSHLVMRQLEFACGYPTASLKERLYISSQGKEFMAGVLIYTTDGSEGSMGGLVSQASEHNIESLVRNALLRGVDCSSDPLCWESDGQGLFDFNLASCFSCSLVAETACEAMNLGLDRRVLVDEGFGLFKELIS